MLQANKKQGSLKSYSLKMGIDSVNQILRKKEKRTKNFSIKDFFSKCDQIRNFLRIWSHLLKKTLMENFIFLCSGKS